MARSSRALVLLLSALALSLSGLGAPVTAQESPPPPYPDPAQMEQAPGAPCTVENKYEATIYDMKVGDVRFPDTCKRIKFKIGPIVVKPGQNDALIEPTVIAKPQYDGYVVRFKPDLVLADTGKSPDTDDLHLHHATWLNGYPSYGHGPFFAAGEEKTIATFPEGYGMAVGARDTWLLLYMVHNDQSDSRVVWLTYDIDYIAKDAAEEMGVVPVKPVWLDVKGGDSEPAGTPASGGNPVFNVQRGFGHRDPEHGRLVCTWPKENCARHDTYNQVTPHQGTKKDADGKKVVWPGADWEVTEDLAGTIVALGGHLHFGGIRDEVSLIRKGKEKMIFLSDAFYWAHGKKKRAKDRIGAPPTSWDFSMGVTGAPHWKVKIKPGDTVRINAVTDSETASWYEGMGIVVMFVAPDDPHGPEGVDVFDDNVELDRGYPEDARFPKGPLDVKNGFRPDSCSPDFEGNQKRLCLRGMPTHGPKEESSNHSGGCPKSGCPEITDKEGRETTDIFSVGFTYGNADMGVIGSQGLPLLKKGQPARLWNFDSAARVWHTYTRCEYPCTGPKDMDYPMADAGKGANDPMDFDSAEIGFGTLFEPASGQLPPNNKSLDKTARDSFYYEFTPTETGTFTFFCRIHKSMRGAFKVVE